MKRVVHLSLIGGALCAVLATVMSDRGAGQRAEAQEAAAAKVSPEAVERSRDTIKLLDNVYKQAVVLITEKYVHDESDFAAGSAAVELFRRIGEGGSHQVRLLDATGEPYDIKNVAQDDFEKKGIEQIKAGQDYYDQVVTKDGKPYLRAITPIPVVMEKCVMCHSHYADAKKGEAIGAIAYELPIK
jgi:hypothetical protein